MKKSWSLFLALIVSGIMVFSLTGCGGGDTDKAKPPTQQEQPPAGGYGAPTGTPGYGN